METFSEFEYFITDDGTIVEQIIGMEPPCYVYIEEPSERWPSYLAWLELGNTPQPWKQVEVNNGN